jgi:hypothetical protein
MHHVGTDARPR